jgi:hypothetical protein
MLAATGQAVHINPDRGHSGMKNGHTIVLLQGYQRVNPIPKKTKRLCILLNKCPSIKRGNVGASLAIFLDLLCLVFTLVSPL